MGTNFSRTAPPNSAVRRSACARISGISGIGQGLVDPGQRLPVLGQPGGRAPHGEATGGQRRRRRSSSPSAMASAVARSWEKVTSGASARPAMHPDAVGPEHEVPGDLAVTDR